MSMFKIKHNRVFIYIFSARKKALCRVHFSFCSHFCMLFNKKNILQTYVLGSPEMAFIHALAAATVTSFVARACRDGQLTSCGCSRGSRPKQLHDDWSWGGCGDNLEYAYKYIIEQTF